MKITVNGDSREYDGGATLGDLLRFLGINPKSVAVERNLRIVGRGQIEAEPIEPDDSFEIIRMVGGG